MNFISFVLHSVIVALSQNQGKNACNNLSDYRIFQAGLHCYHNPDVLSNVMEICQRRSYKVENFTVNTSDGYILTLFKITTKTGSTKSNPVFIQHGVATNSGPWVDKANRSIAFFFADNGYEVWLGNVRGSTYSNQHIYLDVKDPEFWNYNVDTLAEIDMVAQLNFVAGKTNQKIHYIGHSMGTTLFFMVTSTNQEVAQKLQSGMLLAPVGYLSGVFFGIEDVVIKLLRLATEHNIKGLFYQEAVIHEVLNGICKLLPHLCFNFLDLIFGTTTHFLPQDLMLFYSYWPSGTSFYQLIQFLQIAKSKSIQKYDYGTNTNLQKYGKKKPPAYNLTKIQVPTCLFYGENDLLYKKKNLEREFVEIGAKEKCKHSIRGKSDKEPYNHTDFLYGDSIISDLYNLLLSEITKFEEASRENLA